MSFQGGASSKETACQREREEKWGQPLGWEDPQEEGMATHSWRIPCTEEPVDYSQFGRTESGHH